MWVTCYADASFRHGDGGGWAVWLRSEAGRIVRSGACPEYVRDSMAAELSALYAGVYLALRGWDAQVTGVLLRSDCQGALALADPGGPPARDPSLRRLQQRIRMLVEPSGIVLRCKWVKGHQPASGGVPAYLNRYCDKLARQGRRRAP